MGDSSSKLPDLYKDILIIGGGSPRTDGPPIAEVGGFWRHPDYALAYLLAARYTIESAREDGVQNELAMPAVYLQRHALELAFKDLIGGARSIREDRLRLDALKVDRNARPELPPQLDLKEHRLRILVKMLREELSEIGYGEVPQGFTDVVDRLITIERGDPTRLRYSRGSDGKSSFPKRLSIPIGELQTALEALFDKHIRDRPWVGDDGLGTQLGEEGMALSQELYQYDDE